jgi:hypothetical protein
MKDPTPKFDSSGKIIKPLSNESKVIKPIVKPKEVSGLSIESAYGD